MSRAVMRRLAAVAVSVVLVSGAAAGAAAAAPAGHHHPAGHVHLGKGGHQDRSWDRAVDKKHDRFDKRLKCWTRWDAESRGYARWDERERCWKRNFHGRSQKWDVRHHMWK
ncbi:hypothetical protein ACIHFE_22485 [Streptomyces sp. NPDC052396]|uniref:hypothetical protein n=1 Tax=Streptomyces sp. NPDC052396 TaxID=3365689 RepID=UPI0037D5757A